MNAFFDRKASRVCVRVRVRGVRVRVRARECDYFLGSE